MTHNEQKKVLSLQALITETQKKIDDLEWSGDFSDADLNKKYLKEYVDLHLKGDVYYPLF